MSRRSWPSKRPNVPPDPLVPRSKPASAPALEAVEHKYAPFDAAGPRPETLAAMSTPETAGDEYVLDTPTVRDFIASARGAIATAGSAEEACDAIRPGFARLLADPEWLAPEYQRDAPASGMGGGIGQWLLFRAADRSLTLFSLVVPAAAQTPVHDHLAWGLVGLYRGTQDEEIYAQLPPRDDIHRVRTTSPETSVSIHLLTNDTGCVWRHAYEPDTGAVRPFRSGYVNVACEED